LLEKAVRQQVEEPREPKHGAKFQFGTKVANYRSNVDSPK